MEAIQKISIPRNKKETQSFPGKINVLRRFIPNFAEIVKLITVMLKKREYFETIKHALIEAHVLVSLYYNKDFLTFSFALEDTIVVVLLQKNVEGFE